MTNHDWDALAAQWDGLETGDPALLQQRLVSHQRRKRLGLIWELSALLVALGLIAWVWGDAVELRGWLMAAAVALILCQGVFLWLRHRQGLFDAPDLDLVGLIDAEIRRARFVVLTHWISIPFSLLLIGLAWALIPPEHYGRLVTGASAAMLVVIPYTSIRLWQMQRRIRALQSERVSLTG